MSRWIATVFLSLGVLSHSPGFTAAQAPNESAANPAPAATSTEAAMPAGEPMATPASDEAAPSGERQGPSSIEPPTSETSTVEAAGLEVETSAEPAPSPPHSTLAPEPDAADDSEYQLSEAELAELGFGSGGSGEAVALDTAVKLSGFIDFSFLGLVGDDNWRTQIQPHSAFFIGNLNLYLSKNITEDIRTFAEVRFLYLPNGSPNFVDGTYEVAAAYDYNESQSLIHWGGVEIERVYLEWRMHRYLSVRAGQYLTPYGIWNVDHGSPTIISVTRPFTMNIQLFPERQTGLEFFGRVALASEHSIGYHLTLSNGLGPATEFRDLDNNKAIGGRLYWSYDGLGALRVGVSGFYGQDSTAHLTREVSAEAKLHLDEVVDAQSDVLALAGDIQWRYAGLLLQIEILTQQRKFTAGGRGGFVHPLLGEYIASPDHFSYGGYVLGGYRFSWLGIMPYGILSTLEYVEPTQQSQVNTVGVQVGLNIRPLDAVVLKLEYARLFWPDGHLVSDGDIQQLGAQLAWAF